MKPYLSDEECAELHVCFLKDIRVALNASGADIIVCYDDGETHTRAGRRIAEKHSAEKCPQALRRIFGRNTLYYPQVGGDLGEKMHEALAEAFRFGYSSCILIGSDIPEVRASDIRDAFAKLEQNGIVIGPSTDGGYWLIGMHRAEKLLFEHKAYSHGSVLEELTASAETAGLSFALAAEHQDMDTPADLADYRSRMRNDFLLRTSRTGRYLRDHMTISLILPIYNEITTIDEMISQLDGLRDQFEIIIADGGRCGF